MSFLGLKPDAPAAPDFSTAAEKQAQSSQQVTDAQTRANRAAQQNVFGFGSQWTQGPNGQWTQTGSASGGLADAIRNLSSQAGRQGALGTGEQAREQAIGAIYDQAVSRLSPQWQQRESQTMTRLANQGLDPGTEAYENAMGSLSRERNDAYTSAMNSAIQGGTAAQQATFQQNLASQMAPYQQLQALQGLSGQAAYTPAGSAQATQYLPAASAQYGGNLDAYSADQAGKNSLMSGLASGGQMGLQAAALSDARLKDDIVRYEIEAAPGVPFASWTWKSDPSRTPYLGVIAQDVAAVRPDAVVERDGVLMVDYHRLLGE